MNLFIWTIFVCHPRPSNLCLISPNSMNTNRQADRAKSSLLFLFTPFLQFSIPFYPCRLHFKMSALALLSPNNLSYSSSLPVITPLDSYLPVVSVHVSNTAVIQLLFNDYLPSLPPYDYRMSQLVITDWQVPVLNKWGRKEFFYMSYFSFLLGKLLLCPKMS